jgi:5-hydroxyisourate hydrolase-like protein (transthyretin family)
MRRVAAAFAAVAIASAFALPVHSQSPVLIHGRVVGADTGDPLPHARIVIYNDATPLPAIFSDGQGQFSSAPLPQGRYRLTASKAGYAQTSVARLSPDGVDVRMPRSGAIAGRVLDAFGDPAAGVQVQLLTRAPDRTKPGVVMKTTNTDDLGEYRFGGLAEGRYVVSATTRQIAAAAQTARVAETVQYYPGVAAIANAQDIDLHPGDEKLGTDFSGLVTQANEFTVTQALSGGFVITSPSGQIIASSPSGPANSSAQVAAGVIRGRITGAGGLPLAHASVTAQVRLDLGGGRFRTEPRSTTTADDGQYELNNLPAGNYRLAASKLGYTTLQYGQRADDMEGGTLDVADSQVRTRIDIVLPRSSNVMGRVVDEFGDPVENVAVTLSQIRFQGGRRRLVGVSAMSGRTTDDLGRYRIYAVPAGEYVVNASVGQVVAFQPSTGLSGYAPTYFPSTTNPGEAQLVSVPRSQDVTGIDFVLVPTPTAIVSGRKLGSDGQPFGGSLTLTPSQRSGAIITPAAGARIYDDGRFEFPNVAPGDYVIQADQGKPSADREGQFATAFVTVNGADVPGVLLQATPGSTISGRVIFEGDGPPVQSLTINASRADLDRTPNATAQGDVGPDLRFTMTGIHGPRRLTLGRAPAGWMLKSITAKGVDVTDVPLPFGTDDQSLTDVQVVVTSRITELSGTVVDARGALSTDYTLLVFPVDRDRWYPGSRYFRRTGAASGGNFSVRGLPASDYYVAPMGRWNVLKGGDDAWQDPEFLESIALRAARATLTEGGRVALSAKLIMP